MGEERGKGKEMIANRDGEKWKEREERKGVGRVDKEKGEMEMGTEGKGK